MVVELRLKSIDDHVFVMSPEQSSGKSEVMKRELVMSPDRFDHGTIRVCLMKSIALHDRIAVLPEVR